VAIQKESSIFAVSLNKNFLLLSQPKNPNPSSSECKKVSFDPVVQEVQHSTVRISKQSSVSANSQS